MHGRRRVDERPGAYNAYPTSLFQSRQCDALRKENASAKKRTPLRQTSSGRDDADLSLAASDGVSLAWGSSRADGIGQGEGLGVGVGASPGGKFGVTEDPLCYFGRLFFLASPHHGGSGVDDGGARVVVVVGGHQWLRLEAEDGAVLGRGGQRLAR
eukprot:scaffold28205_cov197-Isochrysis_galbana.AAC.3